MNSSTQTTSQNFLRKSLYANALFSTLSGVSFVVGSEGIAGFLSNIQPISVLGVGIQLLVFAGVLVWIATRPQISALLTVGVIAADFLWVIGTALVVYADFFTRNGEILLVALADFVLLLAILQTIGLRRMKANTIATAS